VAEPPQPDEPAETGGDPTAREREILERLDAEAPTPGEELTLWEQLRYEDLRQDIDLRKTYARRMLLILGAELSFVNLMFLLYTAAGVHWRIPGTTMQVWLGATVVQVVGIVYVVTRYLFPRLDYGG